MSLHYNYSSWEFWEDYTPSQQVYGNQKVTFDGYNRLILVNEGVLQISVKEDLYSNWKEWFGVRAGKDMPNSKWKLPVMSAEGGAPVSATENLGDTYFLENGWRIKPWKSSVGYQLVIDGNIFTREVGDNPVIPESNVTVTFKVSSLVNTVILTPVVDDLAISDTTKNDIAQRVWTRPTIAPDAGSYGELVQNMDSDLSIVKVDVGDALTKTEFLALK